MALKPEIETEFEAEGILDEEHERAEFKKRISLHQCTCDLLVPYGHVVCPECNEQ